MKLLGSFCILLGCGWMLLSWQKDRREERQLRCLLLEKLRETERAVLHFSRPIPDLFLEFSRMDDACSFCFRQFCQSLAAQPDRPLSYHWEQALTKLPAALQPLLQPLSQGLDAEQEPLSRALQLAIEELQCYDRERRKGQQQRQQLQTTLYFSAAALLIILLL